jgi:hypothetical protein
MTDEISKGIEAFRYGAYVHFLKGVVLKDINKIL